MSLREDIQSAEGPALEELGRAGNAQALEAWRVKYLGARGLVKATMQRLKEAAPAERPAAGKAANELKQALQSAFDARLAELPAARRSVPSPDVSLPGLPVRRGHTHVLTQTIDELCDIFAHMGFQVAYGPEVEDEWHNFTALNTPPEHVARDVLANFYIDSSRMLRSQTSTVQIRVMQSQPPPVRVISPGRVYRPDTVDATHHIMFHQIEGLYVDEGVSMADLRTCLDQFAKAYFGTRIATRFRPHFFPFTEPSAEVDMSCPVCTAGGCPVCKQSGWVELGGCGMVDPNVLDAVGYDSEKYTGFAFGLGIERMVMGKHGIPDLRLLFENDVRFLRQF